eukprot:2060915-Pleurochrysis_carterae.AAC.2
MTSLARGTEFVRHPPTTPGARQPINVAGKRAKTAGLRPVAKPVQGSCTHTYPRRTLKGVLLASIRMSAVRHESWVRVGRRLVKTRTPTPLSQRGARSRLSQAKGQPANEFDQL